MPARAPEIGAIMALFRKKQDPMERLKPQELDETGILDMPYLVLTVLLVSIGVLMMFSASYAKAYYDTGNSAFYFVRQAMFAAGGILVTIVVGRLNYFIWYRLALPILAVSMVLLVMVLIPGVGVTHNGATRWLKIGIEFQPSEIAKLGLILTFAAMMAVWQDKMNTFRYGVLPYAVILVMVAGLLVLEKHLSATLIIMLIGAILMLIGGTQKRWFLIGGVLVAVFLVIYLAATAMPTPGLQPTATRRAIPWAAAIRSFSPAMPLARGDCSVWASGAAARNTSICRRATTTTFSPSSARSSASSERSA
jgi:cell division protein FtsW